MKNFKTSPYEYSRIHLITIFIQIEIIKGYYITLEILLMFLKVLENLNIYKYFKFSFNQQLGLYII